MSHHKRRRPKHQRAGCLMCKPHKDERDVTTERPSVQRRLGDELRVDLYDLQGYTPAEIEDATCREDRPCDSCLAAGDPVPWEETVRLCRDCKPGDCEACGLTHSNDERPRSS